MMSKTNTDKQRAIKSTTDRLCQAGLPKDKAEKAARDSFERYRKQDIKRERDRR